MQHKHKKKGHPRPIVPVHTAAAAPAVPHKAGNAKAHHGIKHQQQQAKQQQQQQPPTKPTAAGSTGKRKLPKDDAIQPAKKKHKQQQQQQPLLVQGNGSQQHKQQTKQQQPHHNSKTKVAQQSQKQQRQQQQQQPASKLGEQQQSIKQQQQLKPKQQQPKQQQGVREGKSAAAAAADQAADTAAVKYGKKRRGKRQREQATDAAAAKHAKGSDTSTPHAATAAAAAAASKKPWHPDQPTAVGSNWQALKQQLAAQDAAKPKRPYKRQQQGQPGDAGTGAAAAAAAAAVKKQISSIGHNKAATPIVAMDCEMVGVGPGGERDSLARVSVVNAAGNVLFDSFVAQKEAVTDYRTWVSGVTAASLVGAPQPEDVQKAVAELLEGRTLVGHGLSKDLTVLMLSHPRKNIRDTAKYPPFMFSKGGKRRPRALRQLALQELGITIQEGQHSSVDDARAALYLYQKHAATWERALKTPQGLKHLPTANRPAVKKKRVESYSIRDVKDDPMADL